MAEESKTQLESAPSEEMIEEPKKHKDKVGAGLRFVKSKGNCRKCRRLGIKLFLKGEKCFSAKCPLIRRSYAPGQHGQKPIKISDYSRHLQEKQKLSLMYGLKDRQLRNIVKKASQRKENTEEEIIQLLERRLDNIIFKTGWALSLAQARKLVIAGHFYLNAKRINRPGYLVRVGDVISLSPRAKNLKLFQEIILPPAKDKNYPNWLERKAQEIKIVRFPKKDEVHINIEFPLVIEFYKK